MFMKISYKTILAVKERIPAKIRVAMYDNGFNPFDIYQIVKEELAKEKKRNKEKLK